MSLVLTGNQANITRLTATVTALSNNGSGLIRVTTSAPHLFGNEDLVLMSASPAVGLFFITVIDGTTFDLQGSAFSSTGTGTASDVSLTPQIQVPTDGDTFSAQLSGLLSAFQGVMDRTQYLRRLLAFRNIQVTQYTTSGTYSIPAGTSWMLIQGCGSGGGGGGGAGGWSGAMAASAGGGGGAGAPMRMGFFSIENATQLTVTIGASATGGSAGAAGTYPADPGDGGAGADGHATNIVYTDGVMSGTMFFIAQGGAGGGYGHGGVTAGTTAPQTIWTPGGKGVRSYRLAPPYTQYAPGPNQLINLANNGSAIVPLSDGGVSFWPLAVFMDPRGGITDNEGGWSLQHGNSPGFTAGASYFGGADHMSGQAGGNAGSFGSFSGFYCAGAGGGGGGGGGFGAGGNAGNGGNANSSGNGTNGTAGSTGGGPGAGGGGGGSGGSASGTGGAGGAGGASGAGQIQILFIGVSQIGP